MMALICYIKSTGTYRQWIAMTTPSDRVHVVINVYRFSHNDAMLRPCIVWLDQLMMTPEEVMQ